MTFIEVSYDTFCYQYYVENLVMGCYFSYSFYLVFLLCRDCIFDLHQVVVFSSTEN